MGYACSKELVHWEDSRHSVLDLPITPANAEIVDAILIRDGLFNNVHLGFDAKGKLMISYLKYDNERNSQLYHAWLGKEGWQIKQAKDWKNRWAFSGGGTLVNEISFSGVRCEGKHLVENVTHKLYGKMQFELDPVTLLARKIPARGQSNSDSDKAVDDFKPLGSSCIYPNFSEQPIREDALLTGPLEATSELYAVANIAGIKFCESYNQQ